MRGVRTELMGSNPIGPAFLVRENFSLPEDLMSYASQDEVGKLNETGRVVALRRSDTLVS